MNRYSTKNEIDAVINKIDYTVLNAFSELRETKIKDNGLKVFEELFHSMELSSKHLIKVPLFAVKESNDENDINVCSLCFAALTLVYNKRINDYSDDISDFINKIVSTLVYLHLNSADNNGYVFWPSSYNIGQSLKETGTIDQTSSCLSVLSEVGFVARQSGILRCSISEKAYKERISFVVKSIEWILHLQIADTKHPDCGAWPYSEKCLSEDGKEIHSAVLPTFYCIKTLNKYINIFKLDLQTQKYVNSISPNLISNMENSITRGIDYLCNRQREDGGIPKNDNDKNKSSYFHSLLALETLLNDKNIHTASIERYLKFITSQPASKTFKEISSATFEVFKYFRRSYLLSEESHLESGEHEWDTTYQIERFELFVESMIINSCIAVLDRFYDEKNNLTIKKAVKRIRQLAAIAFISLCERIEDNSDTVKVKGRRPDVKEQYPLYCVYYAKMVLCKLRGNVYLLRYFRKYHNIDANIIKAISASIIIVFGIVFSIILNGVPYFFSSLFMALLVYLIPPIAELINSGKREN